ncbi:expressed unknown protein [Seminavis robusta]|uniref:SGNH hydrolase-type esterase domain-containing protein n=1 Tax=Seminavis robusta TaxID=568900 RepID=A0A9N8DYD3_9STRA|nr:expressed unknown protein [Seminavis robusta]|eukprot:Sro366_g127570.1 n/a (384) ;mRNA; f:20444-21740
MSIQNAILLAILIGSSNLRMSSALNVALLGDSYASGNGGGSYSGGSCYRSANAWGKQAADGLGAANFVNNACSGSQVSSLSSQDSVVTSSTNLVLVGTGGNDLAFGAVVRECFLLGFRDKFTCENLIGAARDMLPSFQDDLVDALVGIENNLPSFGIAVLVAYPHVTMDTDYTNSCCGFTSPNRDIIGALRSLANDVDSNQRAAVSRANSQAGRTFAHFYDDTKSLFDGHEPDPDFGTSNPNGWINEFDGSTFEFFHLNYRGHSELGAALIPFVQNRLPETSSPVATPLPTSAPVPSPTQAPNPSPTLLPTEEPVPSPTRTPTRMPTGTPAPIRFWDAISNTAFLPHSLPNSLSNTASNAASCWSRDNALPHLLSNMASRTRL